jgi:hypothetical protein
MPCLAQSQEIHLKKKPKTSDGSPLLNVLKKRTEPTKIYKFKSTGKLPKHHSIVIVL